MGKYADALMNAPADDAPGAGKYSSQLLGSPAPQNAPPEPKKEGWGEWAYNTVKGRQDPKEAGTGTVFEQFRDELTGPTATAAMTGVNDAGMADIIQKNLGDRFIRREPDANGYEVMVTRGPDGQEQRGYVNKPGLDTQDLWRGFYGAAPYVVGGGVVGGMAKGAGVGVNALLQGGTAAATSVAGDVAAGQLGSEQGVDPVKAAVMGAFGAAGPAVSAAGGALWRKFVTIPGLIDKQSGMLTAKGVEAARRAGIDPADVTPDFAKSFANNFARSGNEAQAATQASVERFGIPATRGQMTKDPYLLTQEEGMRRRIYGESAQDTMRGFDERQAEAIRYAALGEPKFGTPDISPAQRGALAPEKGIGEMINPARNAGASSFDRAPAALGEGVQSGLSSARQGMKAAENEAWKKAGTLEATDEALAELPAMINAKISGRMPNQRSTPAAYDMAQEIQRIISGKAPEKAADFLAANPSRNVDEMRRNLLAIYKSAANDGDKSLAKSMYDGFNDWIGAAAQKKLLSGDPEAAMALVNARGFTKEARDIFRPTLDDGRPSPAAARLKKIEDADSGEAVIQALFGAQGSRAVTDGAVQTLQNLRTALNRFAPESADAAWNDVRLAHWTRLVTGKNGELVGPTAMLSNIKSAMQGSKSVFDTLYAPLEQRKIKEFVRALETVSYKPPNASGSGYAAASFAKDGILKLLAAFGLDKPAMAALQFSRVGDALNSAAAKQAVRGMTRPMRPNLTPAVTAAGQPYARDQSSR